VSTDIEKNVKSMPKKLKKIYCEICGACNLRCDFCPLPDSPRGMMSLAFFQQVLAQVAPVGERLYLHVLGEPLLHPELPEILAACLRAGMPVHLVTNGTMLGLDSPALHPAVKEVSISLQSLEGQGQDADGYMARIFDFADQAWRQRPDLSVNFRLWNQQDGSVAWSEQPLAKRVLEHYQASVPAGLMTTRDFPDSVRLGSRHFLCFARRFDWPDLGNAIDRRHGYCQGLANQLAILADGRVVPCCLDHAGVIALGNLHDQSLAEILQAPRAVALRTAFSAGDLAEALCRHCSFASRFRRKPRK
jgi:radical SAM protein with 4Fe4S-binding SPASM domain